jgi:hypothetical protein
MSQVEVDIPLHNALDVGSYGTLLDLFLIQILLCLILHLCSQRDLRAVYYTGVPDCTVWGYTVVAQCCTVVAHCYTVATVLY